MGPSSGSTNRELPETDNQDIVRALQRSFLSKMNTVYSPMNTVHDNHNILETQVR